MAVNLTIVKSPPGITAKQLFKTFGSSGGVIGRGADNDWTLSDPERFLSAKHCQISKEGERYYLTDLSTNGTFVNGSSEPVGRGSRVGLNDGDNIDVGEYRFKVGLERENKAFPSSPFADLDPLASQEGVFEAPPPSVPSPSSMDDLFIGDYSDSNSEPNVNSNDPLLALDGAMGAVTPVESAPSIGSQEDSADMLHEAAVWPEATAEDPVLPDDWDQDLSLLGGQSASEGPFAMGADDSLIVKKPATSDHEFDSFVGDPQGSGLQPDSLKLPPEIATPVAPHPNRPIRHSSSAVPGSSSAQHGEVDRSLVDAMGFADVALSDDQIREIGATTGQMVREMVDGLMQVMRSRASIKNEFRMSVTTIQAVENNPIKFSANADEVLELMFLRRSKAYKEPLAAVEESFHAIADHQVAVIAGIRSAFRAAMGRFDPVVLEEEFNLAGKGSILPALSKGKFWSAYQDYYEKVFNNIERSFQELFGEEFVEAYEEQLRKLAQARKREV